MDTAEQRRKRKLMQHRASGKHHILNLPSRRSLLLSVSFFIFLLFLSSNRFSLFNNHASSSFHPSLTPSTLSLLYSSKSNSLLDPQTQSSTTTLRPFSLQHRLLFPDYLLLFLTNHPPKPSELECVYYTNGSAPGSTEPVVLDVAEVQPVLSTDKYDESRSIARCPFPKNLSAAASVDIRRRGEMGRRNLNQIGKKTQSWDKVAYEATLDGDTVVVFVKGLNLRPHKISDPANFRCHFGLKGFNKEGAFMLTTKAVSVAQEIVRCLLPQSIRNNPGMARGIRVTVSRLVGIRHPVRMLVPSVAKISNPSDSVKRKSGGKYELCACTMVWNQASALREWIMYHAWLGVERWFIYDNNSEDDIERVINDLDVQGYNVSRQAWPWIKTQEAGFSHCALRAREECNWVGFFDVDEFFYFRHAFRNQKGQGGGVPGENSLRSMVANLSSSSSIAEIKTPCHSFGPSGLTLPPKQGVTIGYTCRLQSPERHKSIVRPDLLDISLLNVVHHFQLQEGFRSIDMSDGSVVINHYKYQVWDIFKAKFFRRVATYVVDWQKDQNKGSKDRAPGLGTEAIEPPNWRLQFCEVWDTGLKDFLSSYFAEPATGLMPWERSF